MNKKLKKYLDTGERMERQIAEMKEQLRAVRAAQELEENKEIVRSLRSMKLDSRELFSLLCGLQDGIVTFQNLEEMAGNPETGDREDAGTGTSGPEAAKDRKNGRKAEKNQETENPTRSSEERGDSGNEGEMDQNA